MTSAPADLARALAPLVRRIRLQRRAADAIATGAAALFGAAAALAVQRGWPGAPTALVVAAPLVAATVLATARAWGHRREPITALQAALRAERDPEWRERLSTALEHGAGGGAVPRALVADALARVRTLDAIEASPWAWPRRPLTVLAVTALAVGVLLIVPAPTVPTTPVAAATGASPTPSGTAVGQLAESIAAEARRSRDAYLEALAERLQALADEAGAAPLEAAALARLDELLEAVASASGGSSSAQQLRAALDEREIALQAEAASGDGEARSPSDVVDRGRSPGTPSDQDFADVFTRANPGTEESHPEASIGGGASQASPPGEGEFDPSLLEEVRDASPFDGPAPANAPAELIGAAQEAGAGDSRLAGLGSQALEGDASAADFAGAEAEAVTLAGSEREEGRRIEVELPPSEEWTGYDPTQFSVGAWRATPEGRVGTDPTPLRYREAAGRYFLPSQETAASR